MTDRQTMQQALEALKKATKHLPVHFDSHFEAITALRTRLDQPEQEPVAWMYADDHERMLETETFCTVYSVKVGSPDKGVTNVPLYTHRPSGIGKQNDDSI